MTTTRRILIGTIVALVVIGAGFTAGLRFHDSRNSLRPAQPLAEKDTGIKDASSAGNNATYEISPPSHGLMLETYVINISSTGRIARVEIPAPDAEKIKTGQKVFLYDQNGEILDSMGTIVGVMPSGNFALLEIDLLHNPDVSPQNVSRGKIIVDRNMNAFRLPFSALSRNEKGETFVWEAAPNSSGTHSVKYKKIELQASNDNVFAIQLDQQSSNIFILNPDSNLRDGQKVNVRKFLYKPPSQYEDARIASVVERRMRQVESLQQIAAATAQNSGMSSSCAQSSNAAQDFIDKIKTITEAEQPSSTSP